MWQVWTEGEPVVNDDEIRTGLKPPLRLVEQHFREKWRSGKLNGKKIDGKTWERFREIPEWIDKQSISRGVSPSSLIQELEYRCTTDKLSMNQLRDALKKERDQAAASTETSGLSQSSVAADPTTNSGERERKRKIPVNPRRPAKKAKLEG